MFSFENKEQFRVLLVEDSAVFTKTMSMAIEKAVKKHSSFQLDLVACTSGEKARKVFESVLRDQQAPFNFIFLDHSLTDEVTGKDLFVQYHKNEKLSQTWFVGISSEKANFETKSGHTLQGFSSNLSKLDAPVQFEALLLSWIEDHTPRWIERSSTDDDHYSNSSSTHDLGSLKAELADLSPSFRGSGSSMVARASLSESTNDDSDDSGEDVFERHDSFLRAAQLCLEKDQDESDERSNDISTPKLTPS